MGGSSSINFMTYIRGNKADYDYWASLGNSGWSYDDVLPFFKKSERNLDIAGLDRRYHGSHGEQSVQFYPYIDFPSRSLTQSFTERGLSITDFNAVQQTGTNQGQAFVEQGVRASANTAFIELIRRLRKNLAVRTNSEVFKILVNNGNKAYGVTYKRKGKLKDVFAKREVIVCAGAINSPKLLMLSGIGPKDHLESLGIPVVKNLAVGKNLHDHVTFNSIVIGLTNVSATAVDRKTLLRQVVEYSHMTVKNGPLSGNGPVNSIAFFKTLQNIIPDIQCQFDEVLDWRQYIKDPVNVKKSSIFPTAFYDAIIPRPMVIDPHSRGYLLLNPSDINGKPFIYPNYFSDGRDLTSLLYATKFVLSLDNTKIFKSVGFYYVKQQLPACMDYEWGSDEYIICLARSYTSSPYHPVGTCRMGPRTDRTAVVDNKLRVYGIEGIRVIDASIMPNVTHGNTNAPSIMIGERGVDFVIRKWRRIRNA